MRQIAHREAIRIAASRQRATVDANCEGYAVPDPQNHAEVTERRLDLVAALRELTRREVDLLWLRYWTDLTNQQVALAKRMPLGTVKVLIHRAHEKLGRALASSTTDSA